MNHVSRIKVNSGKQSFLVNFDIDSSRLKAAKSRQEFIATRAQIITEAQDQITMRKKELREYFPNRNRSRTERELTHWAALGLTIANTRLAAARAARFTPPSIPPSIHEIFGGQHE